MVSWTYEEPLKLKPDCIVFSSDSVFLFPFWGMFWSAVITFMRHHSSVWERVEAATRPPGIQISEWSTVRAGVFVEHAGMYSFCVLHFRGTCVQLSFCTARRGEREEIQDLLILVPRCKFVCGPTFTLVFFFSPFPFFFSFLNRQHLTWQAATQQSFTRRFLICKPHTLHTWRCGAVNNSSGVRDLVFTHSCSTWNAFGMIVLFKKPFFFYLCV